MARLMGIKKLHVYSDSQLVVKTLEYQANKANMISYLAKAKELLKKFKEWYITQIPKAEMLMPIHWPSCCQHQHPNSHVSSQ